MTLVVGEVLELLLERVLLERRLDRVLEWLLERPRLGLLSIITCGAVPPGGGTGRPVVGWVGKGCW